jgi:uncharacterized membrane protein YidH (DUF202 family)
VTERTGEIGRDPGRALDRTAMAWTRSALALGTVAGLLLHAALFTDVHPVALVGAVALLLAAGGVWWHGHNAYHRRLGDPPLTAQPRAIAAVTAVTVAAAAVAFVIVIRT